MFITYQGGVGKEKKKSETSCVDMDKWKKESFFVKFFRNNIHDFVSENNQVKTEILANEEKVTKTNS